MTRTNHRFTLKPLCHQCFLRDDPRCILRHLNMHTIKIQAGGGLTRVHATHRGTGFPKYATRTFLPGTSRRINECRSVIDTSFFLLSAEAVLSAVVLGEAAGLPIPPTEPKQRGGRMLFTPTLFSPLSPSKGRLLLRGI